MCRIRQGGLATVGLGWAGLSWDGLGGAARRGAELGVMGWVEWDHMGWHGTRLDWM